TFNGLRKDNGRLTFSGGGVMVCVVNLVRIMAAAREMKNLVVAHVTYQLKQLGVFAEEMLARVGATIGLVILHFAIDNFVHALLQKAGLVFFQQFIPVAAPQNFDYVPASTTEDAFKLLHDFAVTAHRAIQTL